MKNHSNFGSSTSAARKKKLDSTESRAILDNGRALASALDSSVSSVLESSASSVVLFPEPHSVHTIRGTMPTALSANSLAKINEEQDALSTASSGKTKRGARIEVKRSLTTDLGPKRLPLSLGICIETTTSPYQAFNQPLMIQQTQSSLPTTKLQARLAYNWP